MRWQVTCTRKNDLWGWSLRDALAGVVVASGGGYPSREPAFRDASEAVRRHSTLTHAELIALPAYQTPR